MEVGLFSYKEGKKDRKTKQDKRIHRPTVVTDSSGRMESDRMYTKSATMVRDPVKFARIAEEFGGSRREVKFSNADHSTKLRVLAGVAQSDVDIHYRTYMKAELRTSTKEERKDRFFSHTYEILGKAMSSRTNRVIDMLFDNDMVSKDEQQGFVDRCAAIAAAHGKEAYWIEMVDSAASPLVGIQDFIVGAIQQHHLHLCDPGDVSHELYKIIEEKVAK